jgi:hypothetical protein
MLEKHRNLAVLQVAYTRPAVLQNDEKLTRQFLKQHPEKRHTVVEVRVSWYTNGRSAGRTLHLHAGPCGISFKSF